ncbi:MAG: radical SAM protein [Proteobacteria bacterium]|nr:radical SAM protein [Pseudomonadota bacterium]NIS67717.1 radical SAM protein [Pseudomonadota bacterium]
MKILLIEPAKAPLTIGGDDVFLFEPLALEYVAAGVSRNHDVRILDLRLEKDLQGVLEEFCPDIVGITSYTVHVNTVKSLFEEIKGWNPHALTVVGGHHATVVPQDFLSPFIDLILSGEGVFGFKEIITRFERGEGFHGIQGIALVGGDGLVKTDSSPVVDLDAFPFPDRRLTATYRRHYYSEWMKPLASIRTSKGCPYRCNFCSLWKLTGGRYFRRKPEKIVEELAGIDESFVFFADDESLVSAARMKALAKLIKDAGIRKRYFLYGRSDTIARNPELLEMWRDIGLERVFVGLEFFRDEDLEYVGKGSTASDNEKAVRILQDLDIDIYASFIVRPEFDRGDFAAFGQYCRRLGLNFATFAVLTPLPGTDLFEKMKAQLITHNYDYFDFIHTLLPTTLPLKEFYKEYYQLLRKANPLTKGLSLLRKFPLREIPQALVRSHRVFKRVRTAYLDYGDGKGDPPLTLSTHPP